MTGAEARADPERVIDATGAEVPLSVPPGRIVSLVPSISEILHAVGVAERVVGVTTFCEYPSGGFPEAVRVRGTKNPDLATIVGLAPDLVFANLEENRERDVAALREAGLTVHVSYPCTVAETASMVAEIGRMVGRPEAAATIVRGIEDTVEEVSVADETLAVFCPIWRRPWMAVAAGTYASDLLVSVGLVTVPHHEQRYPRVDLGDVRRLADAVLLPSEPYEFTEEHLADFAGWQVPVRLVDGQLLTWHGPRTAQALRYFRTLRDELCAALLQ